METIFFAFPPDNVSIDANDYPQCHLIESQNCASLYAHFDEATARQAHCRFYQETCLDETLLQQTEQSFEAKGWSVIRFTNADVVEDINAVIEAIWLKALEFRDGK